MPLDNINQRWKHTKSVLYPDVLVNCGLIRSVIKPWVYAEILDWVVASTLEHGS